MVNKMFRKNNTTAFVNFLESIASQPNRTLLLLGEDGWGKAACALDLAEFILKTNPLPSSDFFYFRNTVTGLKTEFFLTKNTNTSEAWTWLQLLQRRLNLIATIEESITMPTGVKLSSIKEQLDEYIVKQAFPQDKKFIDQLIQLSQVLEKKTGIPINVIREVTSFHAVKSSGRVSLLADFDKADATTQNAALKLIEEPNPNHWLILTAQNEKTLLPTILSRTIKIPIKKPLPQELMFLGAEGNNARDIMEEAIYNMSHIKLSLVQEFFEQCSPNIEHGVAFLLFSEKLGKNHQTLTFLNELNLILNDALRLRHTTLRNIQIPLLYPQYKPFSLLFSKASTAELEEITSQIEQIAAHVRRSVIKDENLLPKFLLDISRMLRVIR